MSDEIIIPIYILENNKTLLSRLGEWFEMEILKPYKLFNDVDIFLEEFKKDPSQIVVVDYYLDEGVTALEIIEKVLYINPVCRIVVISAKEDVAALILNHFSEYKGIRYVDKTSSEFIKELIKDVRFGIYIKKTDIEHYRHCINLLNGKNGKTHTTDR